MNNTFILKIELETKYHLLNKVDFSKLSDPNESQKEERETPGLHHRKGKFLTLET